MGTGLQVFGIGALLLTGLLLNVARHVTPDLVPMHLHGRLRVLHRVAPAVLVVAVAVAVGGVAVLASQIATGL